MMVILKIPIVYLCAVVWYAWRAEPDPLQGAATRAAGRPEPPEPRCPWEPRRTPDPRPWPARPHGGPVRRYRRREAFARGRVGS